MEQKLNITVTPMDEVLFSEIKISNGEKDYVLYSNSVLSLLMESEEWNSIIKDAKTGEEFTISDKINEYFNLLK